MSQLIKLPNQSLSQIGNQLITEVSATPYEVRINRKNPACFVFLIDQSGSMESTWGNDDSQTKAEIVALQVNNAINELINICQKTEPEPRPYFDILAMGYGANGNEAEILWEGALKGRTFVKPADLKQNPTGNQGEIEIIRKTFKGQTTVKIPVPFWFSAVANSLTPMGSAFDKCTELLTEWTAQNPTSFPPIVLNITDGEQTDCKDDELLNKAYHLKQTNTLYGNTLLFNVHISSHKEDAVLFPERKSDLPNVAHCELLYKMSSVLPTPFKKRIAHEIKKKDLMETTEFVAMTFQASVGDLTKCLDIGTKTIQPY